jgi:septal ring-binding cell division protein DamX
MAAPLTKPGVDASREPSLHVAALPADDAELFKRQPRKSRAGWVLLVLLVSMTAFGFMYKEAMLQELEALKKYLLRGTPAAAAPEEAASAAAAASAASADALAAAELAASVAAEAARVASEAQEVASAASAAASVAVLTTSESVVAASAEEPVKRKAEAKAEPSSDEAWVEQLPPAAYVVQLAAMDTQEDMRSFQRSNAVYAKARILRARQKDSNKRYYILVAGPFESKSQADAFMQSNPLLSKGWLRSSK